jgi:hypothetical protein
MSVAQYGILEVVLLFVCTEIEEVWQRIFGGVWHAFRGCHNSVFAQKTRIVLDTNFLGDFRTVHTDTCTENEGCTIQKFWAHFSRRLALFSWKMLGIS